MTLTRLWSYTCCILITTLLAATCCHGKVRSVRPRRDVEIQEGPSEDSIWDSGLLEKKLYAGLLVEKGKQYYHDTSIRKFPGHVLAYVTPWNKRGQDLAVQFRAKLTHVSPVWYQLRMKHGDNPDEGHITLAGGHEVNQTWIDLMREPVKEGQAAPRIVPRVIIEMEPRDMVALLQHPEAAAQFLTAEVERMKYDGLVLEVWMSWLMMRGALEHDEFKQAAFGLVRTVARALKEARSDLELIMAVPPIYPAGPGRAWIERGHWKELLPDVSFWSIMTYDFSQSTPGPNSPLTWLDTNLEIMFHDDATRKPIPDHVQHSSQMLMGVNFYGYKFVNNMGQPILGDEFLRMLQKQSPKMEWDEDAAEHWCNVQDPKTGAASRVYYPTPRALQLRAELFERWGVGISIWELGQGLECFFDLL